MWHCATVLPRQPAQRSCASKYDDEPVVSRTPATFVSGRSSRRSAVSEPRNCPKLRRLGPPLPPVWSAQIENSPSGACGANACHARTTSRACDHGQSAKKYETLETGCVRRTRCVTTPKLPPPPPRQAQYRSGFSVAEQFRWRPSAVTIPSETTLSLVVPNAREARPTPPPSASPPIPTVAHDPAGIARPWRARVASTSTSRAPAPIVAVPDASRWIAASRFRSTTSPVPVEYPA